MNLTYYELEIFDDVINGDLEPEILFGDKLNQAINYLDQEIDKCQITIFGKYKKKRSEYILTEQIKLCNAHPLAFKFINQKTIQDKESLKETIPDKVLNQLDIDPDQADNIYIKKEDSANLIGLSKESEWKNLDVYHLKYCYFHVMLSDYVKSLKRKIARNFHNLQDDDLETAVNRTHKRLINFCTKAINNYDLKTHDLRLQAKNEYCDKDCIALVYLYINKLINYLFNEYGEFLRPETHILYNAEIIKRNLLQETATNLSEKLKGLSINKDLKGYIQQALDKLLLLDTKKRITFHDINYYSFFTTELYRFINQNQESDVSENKLIIRLLELGFNEYDFIQYIIDGIKVKKKELNDTKNYLYHLSFTQKNLKQCIVSEGRIFSVLYEPGLVALNNWIESEIQFYKYSDEKVMSHLQKVNKIKLDSSVSQIAVMARVFHEVIVDKDISLIDFSRWISNNVRTTNSPTISVNSLKNNMYTTQSGTIEAVKSRIMEMFNEIREL